MALLLRQAVLQQMELDASLLRSAAASELAPLDAELEERLRDLGYLGAE